MGFLGITVLYHSWYIIIMIPKVIYQTHEKNRPELPEFVQEISETWINMNPGYKYVYMNSKERRDYVGDNYPELIQFYDIMPKKQQKFDWHFPAGVYQADIWRYVITQKNGGFYADMDSVCIESIDNIFNNYAKTNSYAGQEIIAFGPKCCLSLSSKLYKYLPAGNKAKIKNGKKSINNSNFGCSKNSHVMNQVIDSIITRNAGFMDDEYNPVWNMGPAVFSNILLKNYSNVYFTDQYVGDHRQHYQFELGALTNKETFFVDYLGKKMSYSDVLKFK